MAIGIRHERKLTNSRVVQYVRHNLTRDVFVTSTKEILIYFNSKIYRMKIEGDFVMLSKEDPTTGSAEDYGTLDYVVGRIVNDPYPWYHNQTREFFESFKPTRKGGTNGRIRDRDKSGDYQVRAATVE